MYKLCKAVIAMFGEVYLREPVVGNIARLLSIKEVAMI
jgi:hypothetical protein